MTLTVIRTDDLTQISSCPTAFYLFYSFIYLIVPSSGLELSLRCALQIKFYIRYNLLINNYYAISPVCQLIEVIVYRPLEEVRGKKKGKKSWR